MSEEADRIVRATLDSLSAHIALVDASGMIDLTNGAWGSFARANGTPQRGLDVEGPRAGPLTRRRTKADGR